MTKNMSLTRAEALKKAELFEELFTVVRILDAQSMTDIKNGTEPTGCTKAALAFPFGTETNIAKTAFLCGHFRKTARSASLI